MTDLKNSWKRFKRSYGRVLRLTALMLVFLLGIEAWLLYGTVLPFLADGLDCAIILLLTTPFSFEQQRKRWFLIPVIGGLSLVLFAIPRLAGGGARLLHSLVLVYVPVSLLVVSLVSFVLWAKKANYGAETVLTCIAELWLRLLEGAVLVVGMVLSALLSQFGENGRGNLFAVWIQLLLFLWLYVRKGARFILYPFNDLYKMLEIQPLMPRGEGDIEFYGMIYRKCCQFMEMKKPFLVEAFSLSDLAAGVFTNKSYVSKAINLSGEYNFRRFVNRYRVRYAQEIFKKNMSLRVVELSMLSGCHSVQTFCAIFKIFTGQTPKAWCDKVRKTRQS